MPATFDDGKFAEEASFEKKNAEIAE